MSGTIESSAGRIMLVARNTLLEAVRQRVLSTLTVIALAMVAGSQFLGAFNFGSSELKFVGDVGFGVLNLFGSILAIVVSAQLFFSEIENRTALTLLAKPVFRWEFMTGKFFGVVGILLAFCVLTTSCLCVVLAWRESEVRAVILESGQSVGPLISYSAVWMFALVQWCKFALLAAITLFIASFSSTSLFTITMGFLVLVICHLQYLARKGWTRGDSLFASVAARVVAMVFPNFQVYSIGDGVVAGQPLPAGVVFSVVGFSAVYIFAFLGLAAFGFRRREI
jgi:ABC-type transport system involved in multi-copper enzyme maturation permease subunit